MIKEYNNYKHYKNGKIYRVTEISNEILIQNAKGEREPSVVYYQIGVPDTKTCFTRPLSEMEEKFKEITE